MKLTPKMVTAGVKVLRRWQNDYMSAEQALSKIYLAMRAATPPIKVEFYKRTDDIEEK